MIETYFSELRAIHSSGAAVEETSYYAPLANLLNEIGRRLKPRVRCIMTLKNQGAGMPDGGLFTVDQFQKASDVDPLPGQLPARGVIEVKGTSSDAWLTADGEQVTGYWGRYRLVLVTNYRDFVLVGQDSEGRPAKLETYRLAESEADFWSAVAHPRKLASLHGDGLTEYLTRVLLHAAPLMSPEDVAWFLASYARDAKARIEQSDLPALDAVRNALEEALGLKFEGTKGEHFFRSSLVQTLFYGVFSAWVLWSRDHPPSDRKARFEWRMTAHLLRVPILRKLFHEVAEPGQLHAMRISEVLDWAGAALNRVDRAVFFSSFEEGQAVQYFYEPFLKAFDPELRKELGVWYTPPEIVQYMVARVDAVLREELGVADGLADPNVYVLDPCCGTGAYLVEVLRCIGVTLTDKGGDALVSQDLKRAAMERVFGFEILPAPFVVAHLQLALLLENFGVSLSEDRMERAGIYLTNALTGWEPPKGPKQHLAYPEMEEERDAAEKVKRDTPILVVLGNPPYNAFAGVSPKEEQGLVEPYKEGLISQWGIKKFNLDDLYVRFFRLAERRIAEMTGKGVVCYISNHSWISDPSFVVLRKHLLESFDGFWIENMHGNRKISEYAPDGRTSETIFAIPGFSAGIRQGVAISLWVKTGKKTGRVRVLFRDDLSAAKAVDRRTQLLKSLKRKRFDAQYERTKPTEVNRFSFRPCEIAPEYVLWAGLPELCSQPPSNGLMEKRGSALIHIDRTALEERMRLYYNREVEWDALKLLCTGLTRNAGRFRAEEARAKVLAAEQFNFRRLRRYALRPFETRWCYYSPVRPLWNEPRPTLWAQCWEGNCFLLTRFKAAKSPEGPPFYFTTCLSDDHLLTPDAVAIPFRLRTTVQQERNNNHIQNNFLHKANETTGNLSAAARAYLDALDIRDPDADTESAGLIWMHALAIGYSPAYLAENADGIRQDWPRIPLPKTRKLLLASARLGRQLAAFLDTESPVAGAAAGTIRRELKPIAIISRVGGGSLAPEMGELDIKAGWGHAGKGGVTMPGKGKAVERDYAPGEPHPRPFGARTFDIYLNDTAYWRNVPARVWEYTIGGYQVIKKWLSYRERSLLGRSLTPEEAREVTGIARRIAGILLLEPNLDANYSAVKNSAYEWSKGSEG